MADQQEAAQAFAGLESYDLSPDGLGSMPATTSSTMSHGFVDTHQQDLMNTDPNSKPEPSVFTSAAAASNRLSRSPGSNTSSKSSVHRHRKAKTNSITSDGGTNSDASNTSSFNNSPVSSVPPFLTASSTIAPDSSIPSDAAGTTSAPTSGGDFFLQNPNSWGVFPNTLNAGSGGGFDPSALQQLQGSFNPAAIPSGFYNPQFQFGAQQWGVSNAAPQFTWPLPQRPHADAPLQQGQQPSDQSQDGGDLLQRQLQQQSFFQQNLQQLHLQEQSQQPGQVASQEPGQVRPQPAPEILSSLTPEQQAALKNIAMPAHLQYHSPKSQASPQSSAGGGAVSSPDAADPTRNGSRKRKPSADEDEDDDDEDEDGSQPVKKTAHNMIEKRYRTNLNDKIAALRDSVPSLRIMSKSARGEDTTEDREELHGLTPAHKLNKATVLSKATEYIRHLEKRNNRLLDENSQMQQRIAAFEKLFMHGALSNANSMSPMAQPSPMPMPFSGPTSSQSNPMAAFMSAPPITTPRGPDPVGMIPVPEEMKRILQAQAAAGRPYPVPQQPFQGTPAVIRQQQIQQQQQAQQSRWQAGAPYLGKMMVGSLAGLMLFEAAREQEIDPESTEGRGLFALPLQLLRPLVASDAHVGFGGYYVATAQIVSHLKLLLLLGMLLWAFVPSFFAAPKPTAQDKTHQVPQAAPSLASPIHVRRNAWLTAIQTVWVPRHNFVLEAAALILKMMKLSTRNALGIERYSMLTGLTQDQETARIKSWAIALDAQLAGGDVEINERRLTLTLLASHTLPDTPLRLMLNALHIRILVRHLGKNALFDAVAAYWARGKWNAARERNLLAMQLQNTGGNSGSSSSGDSGNDSSGGSGSGSDHVSSAFSLQADDRLPSHLEALLAEDCDDVLNDDVIERAYNLAFNRPTTFDVPAAVVDMDGMNAVVEDPAVLSPLDAVAAWFSSLLVHRILTTSLAAESDEDQSDLADSIAAEIDLAAKIAPIGSHAQVRALVARAVLVEEKRGASIAVALQALRPSLNADESLQPLVDAPLTRLMADREALIALRCAMALAHLQRFAALPQDILASVDAVLPGAQHQVSLLACAAAFRLMLTLHARRVAADACAISLEQLAGSLRVWIGGPISDRGGLDAGVRHSMVRRCLAVTRSVVGIDNDTGYGSMSEGEGEGESENDSENES
ncbi:hlh transcription factor [Sporothrix schenckii 1099-18]|uniref:Hlh transcription factor n=1 Tax=Sporothrix schenckii 1099-18 TaxID=1397361 RepID=A0A0F2M655_SPOSC|nr:hlh transcription factor [Sporothrix schenckii 1099-18]KJR85178.1 hlh transcription factor [Sporothrix schenckii 1099-18]